MEAQAVYCAQTSRAMHITQVAAAPIRAAGNASQAIFGPVTLVNAYSMVITNQIKILLTTAFFPLSITVS
jgi:hypothetical protein